MRLPSLHQDEVSLLHDVCSSLPHLANCSQEELSEAQTNPENHSPDEVSMSTSQQKLIHRWVEKFDSACSHCMSGDGSRIEPLLNHNKSSSIIRINGFNDSKSFVTQIGKNRYNKEEYYVEDMPQNLCLLCAYEFAQEGAAILLKSGGYVIRIQPQQMETFLQYIRQFPQVLKLRVVNRTYEVDHEDDKSINESACHVEASNAEDSNSLPDEHPDLNEEEIQEALSIATTFFNTRLNTTSVEERILAYLISGITLDNLKNYVKFQTVSGIHPSVTLDAINKFEKEFGSSPEAFQLAQPNMLGNRKGYMSQPPPITFAGQVVEADVMECDINDIQESPQGKKSRYKKKEQSNVPPNPQPTAQIVNPDPTIEGDQANQRKQTPKMPTLGGALYAFVSIDRYSGYVHGKLVSSLKNPENLVEWLIMQYERDQHPSKPLLPMWGCCQHQSSKLQTP
jgi:hypothetical protein